MRKFLSSIRDSKNIIKPFQYISLAFVLAFGFITTVATGGGDGVKPVILGNWTWVSGDNTTDHPGVYGTKGVADASNTPGARHFSESWTDNTGNLWLFGGWGNDSTGDYGFLNDLWKFDGTNWTWVSGDNTTDHPGVYGTKGVADASNTPGVRSSSTSWTDNSGNLWLLGGSRYPFGPEDRIYHLNDLWKFEQYGN